MSNVLTNLTLFVGAVKLSEAERSRDPIGQSYSFAVWYDSSRWAHKNRACSTSEGGEMDNTLEAIFSALKDAPHHYNLTIETDHWNAADNCNQDIDERQKWRDLKRPCPADNPESEDHSLSMEIARLIEKRTRRGDCFVDIVYSGEDPTAVQGLQNAKDLARGSSTTLSKRRRS